ncbi:MAG: hypothetical protein ACRD82_21445 [Blastocatellia bacterium]
MSTFNDQRNFLAFGLLLFACLSLLGCSSLSRLNSRMTRLAAPNSLSRSAGGKYATTDAYLRALEIPNASETIITAMSQVPNEDAIQFITANREPETELIYRSIASLSWPHEVGELHCGGQSPELLFQPRAGKKIRWLLFYQIAPPAGLKPETEIGAHLKLIPVEEAKEWTSYCLR